MGLLLGVVLVFPAQVDAKPQPTCTINSFTASPASISYGYPSVLSWSTSNCDSVTLDGAVVAVVGSKPINLLSTTTTFKLAASGVKTLPQGKTVTINILPPVVVKPAAGNTIIDKDGISVDWSGTALYQPKYAFLNFIDPVTGKVTQINDISSSTQNVIPPFRFRQIVKKYPNVKPGKNFTVSLSSTNATSAYSGVGVSSSAYTTSAPSGLFTINEDPNELYVEVTTPKDGDTYTVSKNAGTPIIIKWNSKKIPANAVADIQLIQYGGSGAQIPLSNTGAILVSAGQATLNLPSGAFLLSSSLGGKNYSIQFTAIDPATKKPLYGFITDKFTVNSTTTLQSDTKNTVVKGDSISQGGATEIIDTLVYGTVSPAVQKVQTALQKKGFMSAAEIVDDVYGRKTQKAVKAYQKQNKLKVTGTVNQTLFDAITAQ